MQKRLLTLDVFRGITVAAMILVNNPGSWDHIYPPFRHAHWHGCTLTDLIFPFFLIIVGISLGFSFKKLGLLLTKKTVYKIFKRSAILFILGLALNAYPFYDIDYSQLRIMGVLQRISIVYFFAAILILYLNKRQLILIGFFILILYHLLFLLFGGIDPYAANGNIVQKIDLWILGSEHLWQYSDFPFEPEGILSSLPAISTVIVGYLIADIIIASESHLRIVRQLLFFASINLILGLIWSISFPINKSLWTSSYVMYSSAWAMLVLAILIYIIDIKGFKRWTTPAQVFGSNPLFLYVLAWILSVTFEHIIYIKTDISLKNWLYTNITSSFLNELNASLIYACFFVLLNGLCGWILFKRKIFIKI